jgi:hypothetical protein
MPETIRGSWGAVFVVHLAFLVGGSQAQQPTMPAPPPPRVDADSIVGVWKLNVDKSTNPSAASELITIVSQGGDFKLTFDIKQDNEYNPHYEVLTDMKGATVKPTYLDGKQTSDAWRVTRRGPKAFEMQLLGPFGGWKDEYEVSADGKSLVLHRIAGKTGIVGGQMDRNGVVHSVQVISIFEKVQ